MSPTKRNFWSLLVLIFIFGGAISGLFIKQTQQTDLSSLTTSEVSLYHSKVQKIFDNRCVVCHSCNNAPCQINLTTYSGLRRGATKVLRYDGARKKEIAPTRLDIDAHTEHQWRTKEFFPIINDSNPIQSLMLKAITQKNRSEEIDPLPVGESNTCPTEQAFEKFADNRPAAGMPYGLPALSHAEFQTLESWISRGAPGSIRSDIRITAQEQQSLKDWEQFLNLRDDKNRLLSRYLFEHLFLAHIHFSDSPKEFFRLVRSRTSCDNNIVEIASRRPNDSPGLKDFYYCFSPIKQTIVEKTHLPYLMSSEKLDWTKKNFFSTSWSVQNMPDYDPIKSANPFYTFTDIPVEARFRFLLEDAKYHVSTFIKGPVCNGTAAVSAIDEHFYVFFIDPKSDLLVKDTYFHELSKRRLAMPGENGSNAPLGDAFGLLSTYPRLRNEYRQLREDALTKNFPAGVTLDNIWNGDGNNNNAVLTVMRHDDSAYVLQGPRGNASRSAMVLDYSIFERMVYNLVVGFDVYGNLTHQLHTRIYMGMLRMEGEESFLDFFPKKMRSSLHKDWYGSKVLGAIEKLFIHKKIAQNHASQVPIDLSLSPAQARSEMYQKILTERLSYMIDQFPDPLNWKDFTQSKMKILSNKKNYAEATLSTLTSPASKLPLSWVQYLPDTALLVVKDNDSIDSIYTIIKNKRFKTEGSLIFEKSMRMKKLDHIMILPDLATSHPNYFFIVQKNDLFNYATAIRKVNSSRSWNKILHNWGLQRNNPRFWSESDQIQRFLKSKMGVDAGVVDYTHYDIWTK